MYTYWTLKSISYSRHWWQHQKIKKKKGYTMNRPETERINAPQTSPSEIYGYARVSSTYQNEDRQLLSLQRAGVLTSHIFVDHKSGKDFNRPSWKRLVRRLRKGDQLIVTSLDRLGRNYDEIQEVWRNLSKKHGIHIRVLDIPLLDTTHNRGFTEEFITDLFLQILAYVAQMERENIRSRQREGIAAAHLRGVKFGRPRVSTPDNFQELVERVCHNELSLTEASHLCGFSPSTFKRRMNGLSISATSV